MPPKKRPSSPMSDKEFQEEVEKRVRRGQYPAGSPKSRIPPPPTTPPMDLSEQFANIFLGGMPPLSPAAKTPPSIQAQRMAQEERQRQALSNIAPLNPFNVLQLGGASDFGVSRRFQPPSPMTPPSPIIPQPRVQQPQQMPSPFELPVSVLQGATGRTSLLPTLPSPDGVFDFESDDIGGYRSSGAGIHMKGGVLPVFRNMSMGRPADYYEQRNKVFAPWTKDYPNPVELANMDRIERLRFLIESDLARSKIKRPNFGKMKLG